MAQYELNLYDYWRIVKKRRWIILLTIITTLGSVAVYTNLQTPVYQSAATVKVEPALAILGLSPEQMAGGFDLYMALNTEVKIIKSALVAERTALKLKTIHGGIDEVAKAAIISSIQGKLSAERVGDTNLITITALSSDPTETAQLANMTAEVYIEKGIEDRNRRARELRQFVEFQLIDAELKLKNSEDGLRKYTEKTRSKGIGSYIATRLLDLQARKSDLLKKYTDQHPEVARIDQQIDSIEGQMKQLPTEELELARLLREVKINEELYTLLTKRLKEAQISEADHVQSAFVVTPATVPVKPIKPNRLMNMSVGAFMGVFLGFIFALVMENLDTSIGTIEDVEKYLSLPVLGIIPHMEPDGNRKKLWSKSSPAGPEQRIDALRSKLIVYHSAKIPFVESYHTLRTNMKFSLPKEKGNIISFTSAGIGEGKTITSSNFALASAQCGMKTLLLEADLRRPILHRIFGLKKDPGLTDCIIGTKKWPQVLNGMTDFLMSELNMDNILQFPGIENLKIITSGPIPPNPVDLFNSPQLSHILGELKNEFDIIIIDCPPALLFADPLIVGAHANASILIYKAGRVPRAVLKRAKDQLTNVKVNVAGIILNDITSSDMEPQYGYYYYSYKYYENRKNIV